MYSGSQNRMRMRIFNVLDDVKRDHGFAPVVTRPAGAAPPHPLCLYHELLVLIHIPQNCALLELCLSSLRSPCTKHGMPPDIMAGKSAAPL